MKKLPFSSSVLKNCQYLNPQKRNDKEALSCISNLSMEVCTSLTNVLSDIFSNCSSKEDVCDKVRNEWRELQMETLPEEYYQTKNEANASGQKQVSYWEKAFEIAGIPFKESVVDESCFDLDTFIVSLKEKIFLESGSIKYPTLLSLYRAVSSLSHGNSAPENGFSINKYIIGIHGNSIKGDTIEAIRFVKDTILSYGSIFDVPITKDLLDSVKHSKQRYDADLEYKRKLKEAEAEKFAALKQKGEEDQQKLVQQKELQEIKSKLQQISDGLSVADEILKEGNDELKQSLTQKNSTRKELQRAQSKIETGMKRREELSIEQAVLTKKMKEMEK